MRLVRGFLPIAVFAVFLASTAARAAVLPVEATLRFELATNPPLSVRSFGVAIVNGSGGGGRLESIRLDAGVLHGSALTPVTDPGAFPITGFGITVANATGSIARTSGGTLRGAVGLPGVARVCLFGTSGACRAPVSNLSVPLTPVGAGGFATEMGAVNLTVLGAPWTTGTVAIGTITRMGAAVGPASAPGSTALVGGTLRLVTPIALTTNIGAGPVLPTFATLTLRFVPEPATLLLVGGGVAALAAAGARRRR